MDNSASRRWNFNRDFIHEVPMYPPAYRQKEDWNETRQKKKPRRGLCDWIASFSCWSLKICVVIIGLTSIVLHILEFFAYNYMATAFYLLKYDKPPKSTSVWWSYTYPGLLILHSFIQVGFSVLLITGAVKNKRFFMLPWIITSVIECFALLKSSILIAYYAEKQIVWIVATTISFFSVQLFCVVCVIMMYKRFKKEEKDIHPPDYRMHF